MVNSKIERIEGFGNQQEQVQGKDRIQKQTAKCLSVGQEKHERQEQLQPKNGITYRRRGKYPFAQYTA